MKINLVVFVLVILFSQNTYCQQTAIVTNDRDDFYEEYSVLVGDRKVKHGSYLRLNKLTFGGFAIETIGNYSKGQKSGFWEIYFGNSNNIMGKGFYKEDFKDSLWVFFYPQVANKKLELVETDQGVSLNVVDSNPAISKVGKFKNGKPVGVWEYFDEGGELEQKFDFDNKTLVYLKGQSLDNVEGGFIGGEFHLHQYLYEIFDFNGLLKTINAKVNLEAGKLVFKFTVTEDGDITDITNLEKSITNKKIYERAVWTIQSLSGTWYPKKINGNPQSFQKTIIFDLNVDYNTSYHTSGNENRSFSSIKTTVHLVSKITVD